jgi:hypothetical protein
MPASSSLGKEEIKKWFDKRKDIRTIIDCGVGCGTYRKLLGAKYKWIGIEIWEKSIEKYNLKELYDEIIVGDIMKVKLPKADCIIFGDVLEHLDKKDASDLIIMSIHEFDHIVISIPVNYPQGAYQGNPFEEHKTLWTWRELDTFIPKDFKIRKLFGNIAIFIK